MENNELIKLEGDLIKRVGNAISITNKLLALDEAILKPIPKGKRSSTGFDAAWDASMLAISGALRLGARIADAIQTGLEHIKETDFYKNLKDKKSFEDKYVTHLTNEYKKFGERDENKVEEKTT